MSSVLKCFFEFIQFISLRKYFFFIFFTFNVVDFCFFEAGCEGTANTPNGNDSNSCTISTNKIK